MPSRPEEPDGLPDHPISSDPCDEEIARLLFPLGDGDAAQSHAATGPDLLP